MRFTGIQEKKLSCDAPQCGIAVTFSTAHLQLLLSFFFFEEAVASYQFEHPSSDVFERTHIDAQTSTVLLLESITHQLNNCHPLTSS